MDGSGPGLLERYPGVPRRKLDVAEYHRLGTAGVLTPEDRVELIEGELVAMAPIGSAHGGTTNTLARLLLRAVGDRAVVAIANPVRLSAQDEPQPDFALLRPRADDYFARIPDPADVLLLIEVADSSLGYDRGLKLALYARHGIPEVWIVNLVERVVETYRAPLEESYRHAARLLPGDRLEAALLPGLHIAVAEVIR